jgi:hypothetical protein
MKTIKVILLVYAVSLCMMNAHSQEADSTVLKKFYTEALTSKIAHDNLKQLCKNYKGRIGGSEKSLEAIKWAEELLKSMGLDTVYKQELFVRNWHRGEKETGIIYSSKLGEMHTHICALGGSIGTIDKGIKAEVVEVHNFDELKELGDKVKGKIVFFNRAADPTFIYTFQAYGSAADQRFHGPVEAAKYGAIGVLVRSVTLITDTFPHTGIMRYDKDFEKLPSSALSTIDADSLSNWLKKDPALQFYMKTNCYEYAEAKSYNVIGEIRGSEFPKEIIAFGGHLDAWDNTEGAHDDGIGVIQTIEVLRLFKTLKIKPKHTLRVVVFMDEEMAQRGAHKYESSVKAKSEKHLAAIESDRGGFTPFGFSLDMNEDAFKKVQKWKTLFLPYGLFLFEKGGSGVDIGPLKKQGIPLFALITDSQRYFDYQHAASDTFESVNKREMQLGSASIAALVYLIDKYGL